MAYAYQPSTPGWKELEASLKKGPPARVYSFFGEEQYLIEKAIRQLHRSISGSPPDPLALQTAWADETSLSDFLNDAATCSMFTPERVLVLYRAEKIRTAELPYLAEFVASPPSFSVTVFAFGPDVGMKETDGKAGKAKGGKKAAAEGREPEKKRYMSAATLLRNIPTVHNFPRFREDELFPFLARMASEQGLKLPPDGPRFLAERLGELQLVERELEKLSLSAAPDGSVDLAVMESMISYHPTTSIFDMLDAITARDTGKALRSLKIYMEANNAALAVITMLHRHFNQAMQCRAMADQRIPPAEIARKIGMNPWIMEKKTMHIVPGCYTPMACRRCLSLICQAEEQIKSIRVDENALLEFLLVKICALGRPSSREAGKPLRR